MFILELSAIKLHLDRETELPVMFAKRYFAIGEYLRSNLHANPLWRRQGSSFYLLTQTDLASLIQREYPECTVLLLEMHTEVKYLFLHAHVAAAADLSRQLL